MTRTVWIRNADWVVAWDPSNRRHAYLEHGDVVFAGNSITFVGRGYPGAADETIDGRGLMVMPGLINVHAHPGHEASYRGIREEHGVPGDVHVWSVRARECLLAGRRRQARLRGGRLL